MRRILAATMLAALLLGVGHTAHAADPLPLSELARPGRVLIIRHALAPGTGDTPNFRLGDCATQRNLDATGRAQAAQLGVRLADAGVARARVYSSQWCRCLETARLLNLGPVEEMDALSSFFRRPELREGKLAALRAFLAGLPTDGPPVVLVTHQVTIRALTGHAALSGGGAILALNGREEPRVLGEIEAN